MKKRVFVLAAFIFLAVSAIVFFLSMRATPRPEAPSAPLPTSVPQLGPPPTTSPAPTSTPTAPVQNKRAATSKLPYVGNGFTIEYFPDRDWFFIQINKMPYELYKENAEKWFSQQGLSPAALNIEWGSTRGVYPKNP